MLTQDLFARALGPVNKLSKFILTSPFIENNVQIPACQFWEILVMFIANDGSAAPFVPFEPLKFSRELRHTCAEGA